VRAGDETEFRVIRDESGRGFRFADLGSYRVTDGYFSLDILPAQDGIWAGIKRLRFVPPDALGVSAETLDDVQQREDALRALGYL
jgi:hypothetical protein